VSEQHPGISEARDGWLGEPCKNPDCHHGEVEGEYGSRTCLKCGGTGEAYDARQDERGLTLSEAPALPGREESLPPPPKPEVEG
jgi:hypothetical protein